MRKIKITAIIKKIDKKFLIAAVLLVVAGGAVAFKEIGEKRAPVYCAQWGGGIAFFQANFTIDPTGPLRGYCSNIPNANVVAPVRMR